jgi:hypothetical protein
MKLNIWNLLKVVMVAAVVALAMPKAQAQIGFDLYKGTRTVLLTPTPALINGAYVGATNFGVDLARYTGKVLLDVYTPTNTGASGGTLTLALYGSTTTNNSILAANLFALTNFAYVQTPTLDLITNVNISTNAVNVSSNEVVYPGTVTTVAPSGAYNNNFMVGQYLSDSGTSYFTNTGAITVSGTQAGYTQVSFNVQDQPRYIYYFFQPGGTITNFEGSLVLHAVNKIGP